LRDEINQFCLIHGVYLSSSAVIFCMFGSFVMNSANPLLSACNAG
jgi:hypothetical protein